MGKCSGSLCTSLSFRHGKAWERPGGQHNFVPKLVKISQESKGKEELWERTYSEALFYVSFLVGILRYLQPFTAFQGSLGFA